MVHVGSRSASSSDIVGVGVDFSASSVAVDVHPRLEGVFLHHANVPLVQQRVLDLIVF